LGRHSHLFGDLLGEFRPNPMDILQRDDDALVGRDVDASDTGHVRSPLVGRSGQFGNNKGPESDPPSSEEPNPAQKSVETGAVLRAGPAKVNCFGGTCPNTSYAAPGGWPPSLPPPIACRRRTSRGPWPCSSRRAARSARGRR